jgi:hypothetical protein
MRTIRPLIALTVLALALAACAGGAASLPQQETAGDAARGIGTSGSEAGGPASAASAAPAAPEDVDGFGNNAIGARDDAKIIRTGSIELEVSDVAQALRTPGRDRGLGGYVGASNTTNGRPPTAQIAYRIPADRWEEASTLSATEWPDHAVATEQTDAVEVTGRCRPEARIRNLRQRDRPSGSRQGDKISDVLEVEASTDVRGRSSLTAQPNDSTIARATRH